MIRVALLIAPAVAAGCAFEPDLSRYPLCDEQGLTAFGGTAPYSWQVVSGLPSGVSLTKASGDGEISGTPADAGTYSVTLKVTDAVLGSDQKTLSLRVF